MNIIDKVKKAAGMSFETSAVIVYPAYLDVNVPDPHSTILWLGDVTKADYTKEEVAAVIKRVAEPVYMVAKVTGKELFGPEKDITVLKIDNNILVPQYENIVQALEPIGAVSASQFGYSPHVTVDEVTWQDHPSEVHLGPVELWWRDDPPVRL